jgi:tRNA pseudouridine38-40 synthase
MQDSEANEATTPASRRLALLVEYDGGAYAGSQLQKNARTVQSVLEEAILKATEQPARVAFAGRTDARVHALGQVASFLTHSTLDCGTLVRALNAWLPDDVVVREAADVALDFDVRRDARRRHYRYFIDNRQARPALERNRAWHVAPYLDVEAMAVAARSIIGTHDFAAFASSLEDAGSTERQLYSFGVRRKEHLVRLDVVANAFLPHQVRRMVGALAEVGKAKRSVEEYGALLNGMPASAGPSAPAHGLYLVGVEYAETLFSAGGRESASVS